jgi:hypothetical protein
MSGLDEIGTRIIKVPDGNMEGHIPEYWMGMDEFGRNLCWLQQKGEKKFVFKKDLLLSNIVSEWNEKTLEKIKVIISINPKGKQYVVKESEFAQMVVNEMRRIFNKGDVLKI